MALQKESGAFEIQIKLKRKTKHEIELQMTNHLKTDNNCFKPRGYYSLPLLFSSQLEMLPSTSLFKSST